MRHRSRVLSSLVLFPVISCLASHGSASSSSSELDWTSPSPNAVYAPGDTIVGQWTSSKALVSPSVCLCTADSGDGDTSDDSGANCGGTVWPSVKQNENSYSFSFTAPEVSSDSSDYYLQIKDDFGNTMQSPAFSLKESVGSSQSSQDDDDDSEVSSGAASTPSNGGRSNKDNGQNDKDNVDSSNNDDTSQAPLSDSSGDSGSDTDAEASSSESKDSSSGTSEASKSGSTHATHASATASVLSSNSGGSNSDTSSDSDSESDSAAPVPLGKGLPTGATQNKNAPSATASGADGFVSAPPDVGTGTGTGALASRAALPTAAVAVPLALVAATLLASLALCVAHRRALAAQRVRNAHLAAVAAGECGRKESVRSVGSRGSWGRKTRFSMRSGRSGVDVESDIEKAIGALYDTDRERGYERERPRYPVPRQDVRRARSYEGMYSDDYAGEGLCDDDAYDCDDDRGPHRTTSYDRPRYVHHRSCDRMHAGRCSLDRVRRAHGARSVSFLGPSGSPTHSRHSTMRGGRERRVRGADVDDGNESTTEGVLTDYLSHPRPAAVAIPPWHDAHHTHSRASSRSRMHSGERPRPPPRSHTGRSVADVDRDRDRLYHSDSLPRSSYRGRGQ